MAVTGYGADTSDRSCGSSRPPGPASSGPPVMEIQRTKNFPASAPDSPSSRPLRRGRLIAANREAACRPSRATGDARLLPACPPFSARLLDSRVAGRFPTKRSYAAVEAAHGALGGASGADRAAVRPSRCRRSRRTGSKSAQSSDRDAHRSRRRGTWSSSLEPWFPAGAPNAGRSARAAPACRIPLHAMPVRAGPHTLRLAYLPIVASPASPSPSSRRRCSFLLCKLNDAARCTVDPPGSYFPPP